MTDQSTQPEKGSAEQLTLDQGSWGALTTTGELEVVKGEPKAPKEDEESDQ